ncbi:UxaA family hydrolase [Bacillus sp. FJAT-27251]|uniref:UxaA family hydrolase n=1 Tax=Bacillus sp. FJAT-27251 TaxID=1684142 RepID=UPI0006A76E5C|nr:UxaA family hydrolase [Bacillus sp. FJAT-27251]
MKPSDSVAVALENIPANSKVAVQFTLEHSKDITVQQEISFGHKFAVQPIKKGDEIIKYGEVIGKASSDIAEGEHVHVHNLEGVRGRGDKIGSAK